MTDTYPSLPDATLSAQLIEAVPVRFITRTPTGAIWAATRRLRTVVDIGGNTCLARRLTKFGLRILQMPITPQILPCCKTRGCISK